MIDRYTRAAQTLADLDNAPFPALVVPASAIERGLESSPKIVDAGSRAGGSLVDAGSRAGGSLVNGLARGRRGGR